MSLAGLAEDTHHASKLNQAVAVYVECSWDHRNAAELDWCKTALFSGKICGMDISEFLVSTNTEVVLGKFQKLVCDTRF